LYIFIIEKKYRETIFKSSLKIAVFAIEETVQAWFEEKRFSCKSVIWRSR
jgi:hypothetical protein